MKIIGIDPGSHRIGYSILEKGGKIGNQIDLIAYGTINIEPKTKSPESLLILKKELQKIIQEHKPSVASIEEVFFAKNLKTASKVFESRGVILLTFAESGIELIQPTATQIKKGVTGSGTANKNQVRYSIGLILGLKELKGYDDSWDAIAAAFVGLGMLKIYKK
ncbi:MAG: crossover junction endodeoxyribonuclease RuvC [Leptospiraceae bacterium]|nr:crossover junction endodeoxyribonuclease RuvC [Leptospiraceae bacterium]MCP5493280.1 crossover junction endodeoxyribonuclease RuvC [Leptospiraceae bacterium]